MRNFRVRRDSCGRSCWANQFLLKRIIIGRCNREEESKDTHSTKPVNPSHTPRHSRAGERPASKSCQAHQERTGIYTGPHTDTSEQIYLWWAPLNIRKGYAGVRFLVKRTQAS